MRRESLEKQEISGEPNRGQNIIVNCIKRNRMVNTVQVLVG